MRGLGFASRVAERFGVFLAPTTRSGLDPWMDLSRISATSSFRTIFDVGAHYGETALALRRRAPDASIHAFEPFPQSFARLRSSVKGRPKIFCWQTAVADRVGEAELHLQGTDFEFSLVPSKGNGAQSVTVPITTLDRFATEHGIEHVDLLKTDTEGADLDVLRGAAGLLERGAVDSVYAEFGLDENDRQHTALSQLVEFLGPYQFRLLGLYEIHHFPDPWRLCFVNALFTRVGASSTVGQSREAPDGGAWSALRRRHSCCKRQVRRLRWSPTRRAGSWQRAFLPHRGVSG